MIKIGFIDLYLSEWHANNYPNWIQRASRDLGIDARVAYAWAEQEISPVDGRSTNRWCDDFQVQPCATIDEVCEASDGIILLAPSNPEVHLPYAEQILKFKKPTYIDKTFSENCVSAQQIFSLAEFYGTPVFSSSALRYASELSPCSKIEITAGGRSLEEYIVHPLEILVKTLGVGAECVEYRRSSGSDVFQISYSDGRSGLISFAPEFPFSVTMTDEQGRPIEKALKSDYFQYLINDILRFFSEKTPSVSKEETLEVMALRDCVFRAAECPGFSVQIGK